jgi:hypothetical protein
LDYGAGRTVCRASRREMSWWWGKRQYAQPPPPWGEAIERADGYLRQWSVAGLSLLTLVIILGAAMLAWG